MSISTFNRQSEPSMFQRIIAQALYLEGNNRTKLADRLGCSRTTLDNWIKGRTRPACAKLLELQSIVFVPGARGIRVYNRRPPAEDSFVFDIK